MTTRRTIFTCAVTLLMLFSSYSTDRSDAAEPGLPASELLGNPDYLAFCYGGYRGKTRDEAPTVEQLKEDLKILSALGVKLLRTYNTQQFTHAANLLQAIDELREQDSSFEMYVMLGAWIECKSAWTKEVDHEAGHVENNTAEIDAAVRLANKYPDTVKVIAVGNEAMVHWASTYFVRPGIILKWVNHLQGLKRSGKLPCGVWITSSDNYAAWGGADRSYHTDDLAALVRAVDYVSLHTYPFHDTYHTPKFWIDKGQGDDLSIVQQADAAVNRAVAHAKAQYQSTADYMHSLGVKKPIHIGETGWASTDSSHYGAAGSRAADEYKAGRFYDGMREWTNGSGITCFYFEAFDEQWKDQDHADGSENHFGMINLQGEAKLPLWDEVDAGVFAGLTRNGRPITKTRNGNDAEIRKSILAIPSMSNLGGLAIATVNNERSVGQPVTESKYVVLNESLVPDGSNDLTYPSELLKLNIWEGSCGMELADGGIKVTSGKGDWWGCALEIQGDGTGENLSSYGAGHLNFEIRGETNSKFQVGFQTGTFNAGTQADYFVWFGPQETHRLSGQWKRHSIPIRELLGDRKANLADVTSLLFFKGDSPADGKAIEIRNIDWSKD